CTSATRQLCLRTLRRSAFSYRTPADAPITSVPPSAAKRSRAQLESSCRAHRCRHVFLRSADTLTFPEFCSAVAVFRAGYGLRSRLAKVQFVYRMLAIEGNELQSIACRALSEVDKDKHNRITNKEFCRSNGRPRVWNRKCPFHSINASCRSALIPN
uniref:EF-hand domain-containing protein n=1 Tax=Macrostomum lignano TaxID=282301 RepID=A0A1I8FIU3_9PLAT